jgi:hypothetical protein
MYHKQDKGNLILRKTYKFLSMLTRKDSSPNPYHIGTLVSLIANLVFLVFGQKSVSQIKRAKLKYKISTETKHSRQKQGIKLYSKLIITVVN